MMKNLLMAAAALTLSAGAAAAQYVGPTEGKPSEPAGYPASTVAAIVADPKDDMKVTLEGMILRKTADETYVFSDGSGEIELDIDDEDFPNQPVDEKTKLRIEGEVDTHLIGDVDIDVDRVTILN